MASSTPITEGKAPFPYKGETYETWYKVFGDLKSSSSGYPLVILHGGPGVGHWYTLAIADLASKYQIPVVFYDQVGCSNSTHLKEKQKEFWTVDLFMDELESLVKHLGIDQGYDVLGHSWGGMLGSTFAATRLPKGLKRLIISDSPASMSLWEESCRGLIKGMPEDIQKTIEKHEREGTTDSKEFQEAVNAFYAKHLCRVPMPDMLTKSLHCIEEDPTVYQTMNGPSEFTVVGSLKTWSVIGALPQITQPTLIINGKYDEAQDVCVKPFFNKIPKCKWVTFSESSHVPQWEETERYLQVVSDFLTLA